MKDSRHALTQLSYHGIADSLNSVTSRLSKNSRAFLGRRLFSKAFRAARIYISKVNLVDFLPKNRTSFYSYRGSLTYPPCTEGVSWTLFDVPSYVTNIMVRSVHLVDVSRGLSLYTHHRTRSTRWRL